MVSYRYDVNPDVPGGTIIRTQNLGKAEIAGVELMLQQRLTKYLSLFGALTLNRSKLKDSGANTDNQLRNAPDYWGSLGLRYLNPALVNAQVVLRFSDDRYYDDENTDLPYFHMGAYETVDAKVWKDLEAQRQVGADHRPVGRQPAGPGIRHRDRLREPRFDRAGRLHHQLSLLGRRGPRPDAGVRNLTWPAFAL
jgi:outer membrane cobalamin receptor